MSGKWLENDLLPILFMLFPFKNSWFENNSLEIRFGKTGIPTVLKYAEITSSAAEMSSAMNNVSEQLLGLEAKIDERELAKQKRATEIAEQTKNLWEAEEALEFAE